MYGLRFSSGRYIEEFWVHIWAVICRVCVMRRGNCSGCKWWSTTGLTFSYTVINSAQINITVKAQVHLQNWMKDATQRLKHICLWEHRWLWEWVRDRERERERETTLETIINNNICTNYIQYSVGDPFVWYKTLLLHGRTDRQTDSW